MPDNVTSCWHRKAIGAVTTCSLVTVVASVLSLPLTMPAANAGASEIVRPPGTPMVSTDGRHAFYASCDGWVSKFDTDRRVTLTSYRAGMRIREVAVTRDGTHLAIANDLPQTLVLLDADLNLLLALPVESHDRGRASHVSAVYPVAARRSFVAVLQDVPEIWEISVDPDASEIPIGFIHDHRMREGTFLPGYLYPRRTLLERLYPRHFFSDDYSLLKMESDDGSGQIVSLDARKRLAALPLDDHPFLGPDMVWIPAEHGLRPCKQTIPDAQRDAGRSEERVEPGLP